jgi:hypothetical protein
MEYVHLHDLQTGEWIAQFINIGSVEKYCAKLGTNINDYELRYGPSRYAK